MKKLFPAVMLVILILTGILAWTAPASPESKRGEKPGLDETPSRQELILEQKYLEEKITRIRFQQQLLNSEEQKALSRRQEVLKKLEALSKPEKEKKPASPSSHQGGKEGQVK